MRAAAVLLAAALLAPAAFACPPGGCVQIMAQPSGDGDYYARVDQDNGLFTSFTPNSVATLSNGRRDISISIGFDESELAAQVPVTLTYTLKEYDSSWNYLGVLESGTVGQLSVYDPPGEQCSDPSQVCNDGSGDCAAPTSCHWGSYYCAAYKTCVFDVGICVVDGGDCTCDASDVDFCPSPTKIGSNFSITDCPPFRNCLVGISAWSEM